MPSGASSGRYRLAIGSSVLASSSMRAMSATAERATQSAW